MKKISKYTILLLVVFLFYLFPTKEKYDLDKEVSKEVNINYHDIYLIDKNNEKHEVVGGIAHFLEHRLFDYYKGNVMDLYDELGAYTNAFTSYNKTVYYFSTVNNFEECLNLLLDFPATFEKYLIRLLIIYIMSILLNLM